MSTSTTAPVPASTGTDTESDSPLARIQAHEDRDLTDLYRQAIHLSPEVCSTCHARIRDREQHDTNTLGTGNRPTETLTRAGDGVLAHDVEQAPHDPYGNHATYHVRTYCGECGRPGGRARDDTPSKQEALDAVDPLVARLTEMGVPVNDSVLRTVVGDLKSNPDLRGQETEIWQAATAVAVDRARPRDCVRVTFYGRR